MNKKSVVILLLVFISIGLVSIVEFLSYKSVSVEIQKPDVSITIYSEDNKKISSLSESSEVKLKEGTYYYIAEPHIYSSNRISFTINKSSSDIKVDPAYSDSYLMSLLKDETEAIKTVLRTTYSEISINYIISDEKLYNQGEWYSAKLIHRPQGTDEPDIYRVILQKDTSGWKVVVSPRLLITIGDFPNVPKSYINSVNEPLSNDAYSL